jgi:hypothetical protein
MTVGLVCMNGASLAFGDTDTVVAWTSGYAATARQGRQADLRTQFRVTISIILLFPASLGFVRHPFPQSQQLGSASGQPYVPPAAGIVASVSSNTATLPRISSCPQLATLLQLYTYYVRAVGGLKWAVYHRHRDE